MSAPSVPVACVVLRAGGKVDQITLDQRKIAEVLGGPPTVVGAIRSLDVQAVAKRGAKGAVSKHAFPATFESKLKGDVVLFRTDDDASPQPFTAKEYKAWVADGMPDEGGSEDEEGEGEELEEESDSEEESSEGEEEEEEEEEMVDLTTLSEQHLREACKALGLETKGKKEALVARIAAHAEEHADDDAPTDSDDDDDDDDEEEEEVVVEAPKGKGKGKATPTGPGTKKRAAEPAKTAAKAQKVKSRK